MKKTRISLKQARRIALNAQLLGSGAKLTKGKEGVAQTIERLGYVQIDTIAVIERAHHHTLWSRRADYTPEMLHELQTKDRRIFEYWGHAMSYLPMSDYRYFLAKMLNFENPKSQWAKIGIEKCGHLMKPVLERIRKEGPLGSKDFKPPPGEKRGNWWDWKPAKIALEMLFWKGDLMITERRNFQKVYDLTERVLPGHVDASIPCDDEMGQFLVRRALTANGILQEKEISKFLQPSAGRDADIQVANSDVIQFSLNNLIDAGEVIPVKIAGENNDDYYALSETLNKSTKATRKKPRVSILCPFDNLLIQRQRIKNLFGFNYSLECYVPASKRKFGYFTLSILWGENFVGRLDSKADRKNKTFIVRKLAFESTLKNLDVFLPAFAKKLVDLAHFNRCDKIQLVTIMPTKIKANLKRLLNDAI
ncbi:MAG: winged helix-turn-helix domain-containing protein [Planctomycetes bacterium]|nr:winged helix-turn-helix domain-containing protein [Planctomycetota bacterium]